MFESQIASPGNRRDIRRRVLLFGLVALIGVNLRTVILGVPPVLALIQHDLGLSHTATSLVVALPVLFMGGAAWPAGLLAGRLGGRVTVALGLAMLAAGALLRSLWPAVVPLFVFTAVLSLGLAVSQTSMVILARLWFPSRIGLISAIFTDGLIAGEVLAAGLTLPLTRRLFGAAAWRSSFLIWGLPVLSVLVLWLWLAPREDERASHSPADGRTPARVAPFGASSGGRGAPLALRLGLLSGCNSLIYFGMNAWIAPYNAALGHAGSTPLALTVLNGSQLPVSLGLTLFAQRLAGRRWPFISAGLLSFASLIGWVATPVAWQPLWTALLGASGVTVLLLGIALPPLLATRETVARLTGQTLTISYGLGFIGPLAGGRIWDLTNRPVLTFIPAILASVLLMALGATLPAGARSGRGKRPGRAVSPPPETVVQDGLSGSS